MSSTSTSEALKPGHAPSSTSSSSVSQRNTSPSSPSSLATPTDISPPPKPIGTSQSPSRLRQQYYLLLYNLVSAILWFAILARVLVLVPLLGYKNVYGGVGEFVRWVQTLMVVEVVHAAIGMVRSPIATTAIQVASRLLLVHFIVHLFPQATTASPFYTSMLLAWSVTEVVRYGYFVQTLRGADPGVLSWLRYNLFYVLYPVGIGSEVTCIYLAMKSGQMEEWEKVAAWGMLGTWVPGSYVMYTHMMKQRRRQSKGKAPVRRHRVDTLQQ